MKNQKGFSLIELLIVVVIIGIIAAIAIPNLLASRRASNEASAISTLRSYHGAQMTYQSTTGAGNYAGDISTNGFQILAGAGLMDSNYNSSMPIKSGYTFFGTSVAASGGTPACFIGGGLPVEPAGATQTGTRFFAIGTEGVLRQAPLTAPIGMSPGSCTFDPAFVPLNN